MDFIVTQEFSVSPEVIYKAWLDSEQHTGMTGGFADCSSEVGGGFTAWDGYISGTNIDLEPNSRIEQSWRTTEFDDDENDSRIVISLTPSAKGCVLRLQHFDIPDGQPDYAKGWNDHYFEPMLEYFK